MKNKFINIARIIVVYFFSMVFAYSFESFIFDVTKIEITQNGEIYKGKERGIIKTNDGLEIEANNFEYNKILNIFSSILYFYCLNIDNVHKQLSLSFLISL